MAKKCTGDGVSISIAQVSAVVKAAIEKATAGGTVTEIMKHDVDGNVCYAVKYVINGVQKIAEFTE